MARLEIVESGILFINRYPELRHVFASHPHPLQLAGDEMICTSMRGAGLYAVDLNVALLRSTDGGRTWREEGFLHDRSKDERPYSYHDGFLSRMSDGTLVVFPFRVNRVDPMSPLLSVHGGLTELESVIFTSTDGGRSWSAPRVIEHPTELHITPASPIVELADGRWLATFDQWHEWDYSGPYQPRMLALTSSDRGRSWSDPVTVADGVAEGKGYWHGKTTRLRDGRLYSLFWAADITDRAAGPRDLSIHYAFADAGARRWERPSPTPLPGQTNFPAELPDGRMAAIYTRRVGETPGFFVALSADGGRSWDLEGQVRVWDCTGWTHLGIAAPDTYPHSHNTIAFGAPTLDTLADGELYASWWCTLHSITHLRWARLRVAG